MTKLRRWMPVAVGAVLVTAACSAGSTTTASSTSSASSAASAAGSSAASSSSAPASGPAAAGDYTEQAAELEAMRFDQLAASLQEAEPAPATLKDGSTFELKQEIADKVAAGEPINYVISYGSKSIPLFGQQYGIGYEKTLPVAQSILQMNGQDVSPSTPGQDVSAQIAGIEAVLNTGQIDCLSIQPLDDVSFTEITNKVMAQGIPVFTVGVGSDGNELANFTQVSENEGLQAAQIVIDWMKETGNDLKVFAVSGGDPSASWAQGRMKGFIDGITTGVPGVSFVNSPLATPS